MFRIDFTHGRTRRESFEFYNKKKQISSCSIFYLDKGMVLLIKRKIAFSGANWIRLRIIHVNCAMVISLGTRNFRLSIVAIDEVGTRSTTTWKEIFVRQTKNFVEKGDLREFVLDIFDEFFPLLVYDRLESRVMKERKLSRTIDHLPNGVSSLNRKFIVMDEICIRKGK